MKTIKCDCGEEILILPCLKQMNIAIEAHLKARHPVKKETSVKDIQNRIHLRHVLAQQVLEKVSAES